MTVNESALTDMYAVFAAFTKSTVPEVPMHLIMGATPAEGTCRDIPATSLADPLEDA